MSEVVQGIRSEPDLSISSASRAPRAEEFKSFDRRAGSLTVSKWTCKLLRRLTPLFLPKPDFSGLSVRDEPQVGQGMRIFQPDTVTSDGAMLLMHGGGFVLGTNADIDDKVGSMVRSVGVPAFSPTYRVGPEDRFPAGLDDAYDAWLWVLDNAERYGVDPNKIVIGGYSAGGGMAASLAQRIYDAGGIQPAAQLLVYPMLDDDTAANRSLDKPRHRLWSNANNLYGWSSYLGHAPGQPSAQYAVAARREDLSGLPPAFIAIGTPDLFLDESREYRQRLLDAGVDVTYVEIDGAMHGFDGEDTPLTKSFREAAAAFMRRFV